MAILPNLSLIMIMICFWVCFYLVDRFLLRPVGTVLAERERRIGGAEREWSSKHEEYLSATAKLEAELEEAARQASRVRSEFRETALERRQQLLQEAQQEAADKLDSSLQTLADDAMAAEAELAASAKELARLFASRLLSREVAS